MNWIQKHIDEYESNAAAAHDWDPSDALGDAAKSGIYPTLLLRTTGRKSGQQRSIPLLYQPCGEGYLIIASKGGAPANPLWYENLLANPRCEVVAGVLESKATAKTVTGAERAAYWDLMVRFWPSYTQYQANTDREIPVVVLAIDDIQKKG